MQQIQSPQQLQALMQRAQGLARRGAFREAMAVYEQIVQAAPRAVPALVQLATLCAEQGEKPRAIQLLRRAHRAAPQNANVLLRLGVLLRTIGRESEALGMLRQAAKGPNPAPALIQIAEIHDHAGKADEARAALEEAVERHEENLEPRVKLAAFDARQGRLEEARDELERIVDAKPADHVLTRALHELGVVRDQLGDCDDAWDAWTRSKTINAKLHPQAEARDRFIYGITADFRDHLTSEMLARWNAERFDDGLPVVGQLVGFPRTGTTLTEMVLASHPKVVTLEERDCLDAVARELRGEERMNVPTVDGLSRDRLATLRRQYHEIIRRELGDRMKGASVVIDKGPLHTSLLGFVTRLTPGAPVICALRDPRDVMVSCYAQLLHRHWFLSLEAMADLYALIMGFWLRLREMLPLPFVEVRYEDTVADLGGQARRILETLGVEWDERVLRFHETAGERYVSTPSFEAVRKPITESAVARWKRYEKQLEPAMDALRPFIEAFGYDV